MEFKDYYQILGVKDDASQDEIKRAYRKLARKFHPDVSKEADAEERFKEVNEAYEALKDEEKRTAYDQLRKYGYHSGDEFRPPPGWHYSYHTDRTGGAHPFGQEEISGFSDFFRSIFSDAFDRAGTAGFGGYEGRRDYGARDKYAQISITLEEAFRGARKRVSYGAPRVDDQDRVAARQKTLDINIPPGVTDGQHLRLQGMGSASPSGKAGNLYIEINILPHKFYVLEGRDISISLPLSPWEAALGCAVPVPTPGGKISLTIPAGTRSGRKFRLKGRGMPGSPPGDLYVVAHLVNPPTLDAESREHYEQLAKICKFNPRSDLGV